MITAFRVAHQHRRQTGETTNPSKLASREHTDIYSPGSPEYL